MDSRELSAHRRDRARFVLAAAKHGKLQSVDAQTARDVLTFARSRDNPFPDSRVPRVVRTAARLTRARERRPSQRRRQRTRRVARTVGSRGDPHPSDDDPSELDEFRAERGAWDGIGLETLGEGSA
jgi:hypothetical protein